MTFNCRDYFSNIIVSNNDVNEFKITNIKELKIEDLTLIVETKPDLVIFGTGSKIVYPNNEIINLLRKNGIGYEIMSIPALCRTFNFLISENRKVACILFF